MTIIEAMKAFARLFFALGLLTALLLFVFPDALKFVSIPADDSVLRNHAVGARAPAGHSGQSAEAQPESPAVVRTTHDGLCTHSRV